MVFRFLGLILLSWTLQLGGGQQLKQLGAPILVTLAHHHIPLACEVHYPYNSAFKTYSFYYYHINLQGKQSAPILVNCPTTPGIENKTHTDSCSFTLTSLHNASATGTYYCQVKWSSQIEKGRGTFILVRDAGYKEPPEGSKKLLLCTFTSLLVMLSILATGLLLWKAKGRLQGLTCPVLLSPQKRRSAKKIPHQKDPDPAGSSAEPKPDQSGSIYTALQSHQTEVYDCLQNDVSVPPSEGSPPTQGQHHMGGEELNAIYENF
ncbi:NFAT activation molecule 1 [Notamacropus eugenii]|uniref:NFAT activation molecule 1 n=1 Tax=Notamacropus eugenii TaxID=9315 RepID=UPI003B67DE39